MKISASHLMPHRELSADFGHTRTRNAAGADATANEGEGRPGGGLLGSERVDVQR